MSPAVVSYVLNDGPRPVSASARERVLEAVRELGYRPDGLARSLRVGRSHTLGLVMPDTSNPFFAELGRAVEDAAYRRGYGVLVCNSADDPHRERTYIERLAERRIEGLVLVSATAGADLSGLTDLSIPVIVLDRAPDEAPISTIRSDNRRGAFLGTQHLLEHGHTRIAFVGGPDTGVSDARQEGYLLALAEAGVDAMLPVRVFFGLAAGAAAASMVMRTVAPTAVLVSSDVQAIGLIAGLRRMGLAVPRDIAVVSIDGTAAGEYASPSLTSIVQPIVAMGETAVEHLVRRPGEIFHQALDNTLRVGISCGCPDERTSA